MVMALTGAGYVIRTVDGQFDARDMFRHECGDYDLVIHAAAVGADRATIDANPLALAMNLELDAALFTWAARVRPRRIVYLSSSAAYPVDLQTGEPQHCLAEANIDFQHPCLPDALYGWVKLTGEKLAAEARANGIPVSVVRIFSGFGEDQGSRFPFGALAGRARHREDPFIIWGTAQQVRDFVHVDDVVSAILTMAREDIDGPVNIGTGRATTMRQLAEMMCAEAGHEPVFRPVPGKPSGVAYRVADVTLMNQFYTARVTLEEGVKRVMAA